MANFSQAYYSICSNVKQRVTADWFFVVEDSLCHVSLRDILPTAFFPTKFRAKDNLLVNVIACIVVGDVHLALHASGLLFYAHGDF